MQRMCRYITDGGRSKRRIGNYCCILLGSDHRRLVFFEKMARDYSVHGYTTKPPFWRIVA